ncbi:MAG: flagellar hook-associated protein 3 FlgL [Alphaproteobacteria bacterium]|jgi:flagellin-like hook-associated protein FlgL|nr:flagellar hook-associated protein 3 FlgL [Alphaproteobacteria bacterium]
MSISGIGSRSALSVQSLIDMRRQLDDLQRQLGSGKKTTSYAGLGLDRGLAVGLHSKLSALASYDDTITNVGVRLTFAQTALDEIGKTGRAVRSAMVQSTFAIDGTGQTVDQKAAYSQLDAVFGSLSTQVGDRYLFSGKSVDQPPVETTDHIINGDATRAGLKQVISERQQADLGASGLGRLLIPAAAGSTVSVGEDVAGSPFGLKLASVSSSLTGAIVTGPVGSPPGISIALGASNPNNGDSIKLSFALPDGTSTDLTLTATTSASPGPNQFRIGATPAATAINLQAALTAGVAQLAGSSLMAASAMNASSAFFNADATTPPQRVAGPPLTATALVAGSAANTVIWYTGEAGGGSARATATARIDASISVSYGMRANEQALRSTVQNIAVLAATSYSATDPNAAASYTALTQRVGLALDGVQGQQKITDIASEIAGAQTSVASAKARHQQSHATLSDLLQSIEGVSMEQVGSQILALQTSLQASLQTTSLMSKINLLNYMPS